MVMTFVVVCVLVMMIIGLMWWYYVLCIVPPQILEAATEKLSVVAGNAISMQCRVTGIPTPTLVWLHNSATLLQTDDDNTVRLLSNDSLLQRSDVQVDDGGEYTCHAENEAGFADKTFILDVWGKTG